jgi:signal transduction histidine kinase
MARPLNILLVDDNRPDRELVLRLLPPEHSVRQAATAAEARTALDEERPDLVLLDYRLPDADGTSLLPHLAARHLPVVMLTGMDATSYVVEAMQGGAHDYLVKNDLSEESLERAIKYALDKARLQRAVVEQQQALARQASVLEAKNREISSLASALTLAEQAERRRLADLLHDHLQQLLFGVKLSLGGVAEPPEVDSRRQRVADVEALLDQAIALTRDLAVELTPPVLDREELEVSLRWLAHHMHEMYDLDVEVEANCMCSLPSRELRVLLLQVVRELLFNVVKHAETRTARITLERSEDGYAIHVSDPGRGFDAVAQRAATDSALSGGRSLDSGYGLYSARERLALLGGQLAVESRPGSGTVATIRVPLSVGRVLEQSADRARAAL